MSAIGRGPAATGILPRALPRALSPVEAWGFGLSGLLCWLFVVPVVDAALGHAAPLIWVPAVLVALLLNRQDRRLSDLWPDAAGGTPVYAARLLRDRPALASYAALAYVQGWAAFPPLAGVTLAGLINDNLAPIGIRVPTFPLQLGMIVLAYVLAFGGTRALSALHVVFALPAFGLLIAFAAAGLGWLACAPALPPQPAPASPPSVSGWAKWYFIITYAVHGCSAVATGFVADSRRPAATRRCLGGAALMLVLVHLGGTVVVAFLGTHSRADGTGLNRVLSSAAEPFWGGWAPTLVTFLIASGCLLGSATTSALCPRVFYQLARDGRLPPVLGYVSRRGVPAPALILCLINSLAYLLFDFTSAMIVSNTGWFASYVAMHLGCWLRRGDPGVRWPRLSLALFVVEGAILVAGGLALGFGHFALGLLMPALALGLITGAGRLPVAPARVDWWTRPRRPRPSWEASDDTALQATILLGFICLAALAGWVANDQLVALDDPVARTNLLAVFLLAIAFAGVAAAAWTALRRYADVSEARAEARGYLASSLDGLVAVDARGFIRLANPAAHRLLAGDADPPAGRPLSDYLVALAGPPRDWPVRGEQRVVRPDGSEATVEISVAPCGDGDGLGYVAALHDLSKRKRAEEELRRARDDLDVLVAQRTAELARANAFLADLASTDGLTGLKNRRHFDQALGRAVVEASDRGEAISVVLLDVDRFKAYNDDFGHPAGDDLLRRMAGIIRDATRGDDLPARYGGEEFVLILPGADAEAAVATAERLRQAIAAAEFPFRSVTASFGVATAPPGAAVEVAALLEGADQALYRSKQRGRNRVTHHRDMSPDGAGPARSAVPGRTELAPAPLILPPLAGPLAPRATPR